ncbi:hypothetical protein [Ammoniphilus sp. 3BR4]|uniref:hypothetical protein n=1 Tax=Ammoniphilus sp. 3BR4 TaxID=3158265 RepID=UPI0034650251
MRPARTVPSTEGTSLERTDSPIEKTGAAKTGSGHCVPLTLYRYPSGNAGQPERRPTAAQ